LRENQSIEQLFGFNQLNL